jgi:hypothetical protein
MKPAVILIAMRREQDGAKLHHDARSQQYNRRHNHAVLGSNKNAMRELPDFPRPLEVAVSKFDTDERA